MNIEDLQLIEEFVIESKEHLGDIETDFLTMELQGEAVDVDLVNKVFRAIHSIKGAAGFMGLTVLEKLAHREEEVLNRIRTRELVPTVPIVGTLLKSTDALKSLLDSITTSNEMDVSQQIAELDQILAAPSPPRENTDASETTEANLDQIEHDLQSLDAPAVGAGLQTDDRSEAVASAKQASDAQNEDLQADVPLPTESKTSLQSPPDKTENSKPQSPAATDPPSCDASIRVDVRLLDTLMNQVGELVLARNQMLQFASRFDDNEYNHTSQRLNLITSELQEGVMKTRMQPIGNVWSKFPRLVRDLSHMCEKEVRIEMEGKETELDKTIIEAIKDPLTHLVRNTVDHGIETPEARESAGKPREGRLLLRAFHEGGQVNIEISDDGAGLNLDRIRENAVKKGIITTSQADTMADQDVCNLIFAPGFSTAEKVSNVSGRGVGMDVVKTNIEKIGGTLDLESRPGRGTTIRIKIPLTLAIIPALLVTCSNSRFAIPQVNLMELVRLEGEHSHAKIEWIQDAPVYRLRGHLLPLIDLRTILRQAPRDSDEDEVTNIVVLRADDQQFGLIVDRINDGEEIVVKPLSQQIKDVAVYSGTTILGDGSVALILDVLGIAQRGNVLLTGAAKQKQSVDESNEPSSGSNQTLLILGLDDDRRVAMPMSQVDRLEQVPRSAIENANNRYVIQYRSKILPLINMADFLGFPSKPIALGPTEAELELLDDDDEPSIRVVVYTEANQSVGLVVDQILDIIETRVDLAESTKGHGILGSAIIQESVIDLVDLQAINESFHASIA